MSIRPHKECGHLCTPWEILSHMSLPKVCLFHQSEHNMNVLEGVTIHDLFQSTLIFLCVYRSHPVFFPLGWFSKLYHKTKPNKKPNQGGTSPNRLRITRVLMELDSLIGNAHSSCFTVNLSFLFLWHWCLWTWRPCLHFGYLKMVFHFSASLSLRTIIHDNLFPKILFSPLWTTAGKYCRLRERARVVSVDICCLVWTGPPPTPCFGSLYGLQTACVHPAEVSDSFSSAWFCFRFWLPLPTCVISITDAQGTF